jgi:hypothetical protein
MEDKLLRHIKLLLKLYQSVNNKSSLSREESEEFNSLCREIFEELICNPGGIIYIRTKEKKEAYKAAIESLFEIFSGEQILDEILSGGYGGIVFDELDKYSERAKKLIPTFVSIEPSFKEFYVLYNEAMKCWFNGLENSAVIISCTLLENTLKSEERKRDKPSRNIKLFGLINKFESIGALSAAGAEKAHMIRDIRNKIVHHGLNVASAEALDLVRNTKDILEEIFN